MTTHLTAAVSQRKINAIGCYTLTIENILKIKKKGIKNKDGEKQGNEWKYSKKCQCNNDKYEPHTSK